MSDPATTLLLIVAFLLALSLAGWFKNLESIWKNARAPLIAGVISGLLAIFAAGRGAPFPLAIGIVLTLAALYVRLTGSESEPSDGMLLGAISGSAAAVPLLFTGESSMLRFTQCLLAGAIAGYGTTFGLSKVHQKVIQLLVDIVTAALAIAAAWLVTPLFHRFEPWHVATAAAVLVVLMTAATLFAQWPGVERELKDEARLGFIEPDDVKATAHPFLRLGRGGWHDRSAHREFVRLATRIALRKRQQRQRTEEAARIYQLEVIKLRMDLQEMTRIDRLMRLRSEGEQLAR